MRNLRYFFCLLLESQKNRKRKPAVWQAYQTTRKSDNMSIPFKATPRVNPQDKDAKARFYASPSYYGTLDIDDICEEIAEKTALTPSEVHGVVNGLLSSIPKYMLLGYKIKLNGLGIFRYAFSGSGKENSEDVVHTDIKKGRIHFSPDVKLMAKIENPEFTRV